MFNKSHNRPKTKPAGQLSAVTRFFKRRKMSKLDKMITERKHLVSAEVDKFLNATNSGRNEARDRCFLLRMLRNGLRVSEACGLQLSQVDTESRVLHVARLKKGQSTTHPLRTDELKAVKSWLSIRIKMKSETDSFFLSNRRGPLSRKSAWLATRNYGELAGQSLSAHPHMLRHGCGFALADQWPKPALKASPALRQCKGYRHVC
jgi:type 1 fimbriae regulatory protein FimB